MEETWVMVDDTDPGIKYSGVWMMTSSAIDSYNASIGYDNTAHAVLSASSLVNASSPASFKYTFDGTKLAIYGIAATFNKTLPVPGPALPQWECIVDDTTILPNNNPWGLFPWHSYCETDALKPGKHTVELRVTDSGIGMWVDFLRFLPSPTDASNTNVTAWIDSMDTRLAYRDDWAAIGAAYMTTSESQPVSLKNPALSLSYNGSSVAWYALSKSTIEKTRPDLPALRLSHTTSSSIGFYRIDNGPAQPFLVDISSQPVAAEINPYNTLLFQTRATVPGPHTLTVYYDGNSTVWPLTLDYLTIENSLIGATASVRDDSGANDVLKSSRAGVIGGAVGGVVGGLLVLCLGLVMLRRYRMRQQKRYTENRVLHLAKRDFKLHPFNRMVDPKEKAKKPAGQYPFAPDEAEATQA